MTATQKAATAVLAQLTPAIAAATHAAVRDTAVGLAAGEVVDTGQIAKEVSAVGINQTNNEPWWTSRVTLFAIGGILTTLYTADRRGVRRLPRRNRHADRRALRPTGCPQADRRLIHG